MKKISIFALLCLCTVAAGVTRVLCLLYVTEPDTGFFIQRLDTAGILMTVFVFALVVALFVFSFFCKERFRLFSSYPAVLGVISVLLGILLLVDLFTGEVNTYVPAWQTVVKQIFGVLSAFVFLAEGVRAFVQFPLPRLLFVFPELFIMFQLIVVFTSYANLAIIGEHLFELAEYCFLLLFFYFFGKTINGISNERELRFLLPIGLCSSLLCLSSAICRFTVMLAGCGDKLHGEYPLYFSEILFGAYILAVLFFLYRPATD